MKKQKQYVVVFTGPESGTGEAEVYGPYTEAVATRIAARLVKAGDAGMYEGDMDAQVVKMVDDGSEIAKLVHYLEEDD